MNRCVCTIHVREPLRFTWQVNTPPGAYDLYSEHETIHSLARLIFQRLDIQRWLFKIDDEFLGRGAPTPIFIYEYLYIYIYIYVYIYT